MQNINSDNKQINIVLIGCGIMSATLGIFIKILEPKSIIYIYERLTKPAQESSNAWNNSGTGHAAFCELNYTTQKNGIININKAIKINESFELSRQLWAYLVNKKILNNPTSFINNVPHISLVWGEKNINFLYNRFSALQKSALFKGMIYSENYKQIQKWIPLIIEGRHPLQKIAATKMEIGTDVNFGEITRQLIIALQSYENIHIYYDHEVIKISQNDNNTWNVYITYNKNQKKIIKTNYIFIGGGGASLNILQTANIQETNGYAGFPVGGQFLMTKNPDIVNKHLAKVYGMPPIDGPPMSVPHIDTRIINEKKILLFGPFATFNSKFLKYGSYLDLFYSLNKHNLLPILQAGVDNIKLIKYLIKQVLMSHKDKFFVLKEFYPQANIKDWSIINAGQRVQIIKKNNDQKNKGTLKFGTEIISSADGTLSSLLGASPGASTATSIALELLHIMFKNKINTGSWKNKIQQMVPSYTKELSNDIYLTNKIRKYTSKILELIHIEITNEI